jgi:hypothetical protein
MTDPVLMLYNPAASTVARQRLHFRKGHPFQLHEHDCPLTMMSRASDILRFLALFAEIAGAVNCLIYRPNAKGCLPSTEEQCFPGAAHSRYYDHEQYLQEVQDILTSPRFRHSDYDRMLVCEARAELHVNHNHFVRIRGILQALKQSHRWPSFEGGKHTGSTLAISD